MGKIAHADKSFEQRLEETTKILDKYSDRVCIYVQKSDQCDDIPNIDRKKYLVPNYLSIGQFIYVIRKRIHLQPDKALFLYTNQKYLLSGSTTMLEIYNKHKDDDGFMYITYTGEKCFG